MTIHRGAEQFLMRSHHVVGPSPGKNAVTGEVLGLDLPGTFSGKGERRLL
jgi:hypothetical protein